MKEHETKELEQLIAKAMQKSTLEKPSLQFTDNVMAALIASHRTSAIVYRPLIPKYIWVAIGVGIFGITAYLWFLLQPAPLNLPALSLDFMENNPISKEVSAFTVSKITVYAFLLLALMLCVQIPMLKRYFDKQQMI
ncbi:hypothetical protein QRD02_10465 [Aequorivita sp. SDUM287046]|uniref:Uncharacterized protein n=1 Tax=Aequorivita aurantiaca TaxID=3053356 RepID=A0ABT8DP07_9FLAO|nr:hypothetical protein [Aequorivita aurantiaca]MDN3724807.1 hypothetical protein [Aequorivita aurantiaca]